MSLILELSTETEAWIDQEAARRGLLKTAFAIGLIEKEKNNGNGHHAAAPLSTVPAKPIVDPTTLPFEELTLRQYESKELTDAYIAAAQERLAKMTPEEIAALEAENQELRRTLDENRLRFREWGAF